MEASVIAHCPTEQLPVVGDVRARVSMLARIGDRLFELAVAIGLALIGLTRAPQIGEPARAPFAVSGVPWQDVWSALYVLGALCVIVGMPRKRCHVRATGLLLLATGLVLEGIAAMSAAVTLRAGVYFVYAAACSARVGVLVCQHRRGMV